MAKQKRKSYTCRECGKTLYSSNGPSVVLSHIREEHPKLHKKNHKKRKTTVLQGPVTCKVCGKKLASLYALSAHGRWCEGPSDTVKTTEKKVKKGSIDKMMDKLLKKVPKKDQQKLVEKKGVWTFAKLKKEDPKKTVQKPVIEEDDFEICFCPRCKFPVAMAQKALDLYANLSVTTVKEGVTDGEKTAS